MIDSGFHPPTIYFPLTVNEAIMIEPTETESKETLDAFIKAMITIAEVAKSELESFQAMPITTEHSRFDEATAPKALFAEIVGNARGTDNSKPLI